MIPTISLDNIVKETIHLEIREESYIIDFEEIRIESETAYLMMVYPLQKIKQMDQSTMAELLQVA